MIPQLQPVYLAPKILVYNTILQSKEPICLEEMADSGTRTENKQNEPGALFSARK